MDLEDQQRFTVQGASAYEDPQLWLTCDRCDYLAVIAARAELDGGATVTGVWEWLASAMVTLGVVGISYGISHGTGWAAFVGVLLLTWGIWFAIEVAKEARR